MAKATHQGTCQICGRPHKLPDGLLAKHGYTVDHGYFNGTCSGTGNLPYELSCERIKPVADALRRHIEALVPIHDKELAEGAGEGLEWAYLYPTDAWSRRPKMWGEVKLVERADGILGVIAAPVNRDGIPNDNYKPLYMRQHSCHNLEASRAYLRERRDAYNWSTITSLRQSLAFMRKRIADWTHAPKKLINLEKPQ